MLAVEVLKERGVPEDRILFLNLISSPEGIERFATKFPKLHVITAFIDQVCPAHDEFHTLQMLTTPADNAFRGLMRRSSYIIH